MTVVPLDPVTLDVAPENANAPALSKTSGGSPFSGLVETYQAAAGSADRATRAERDFASGSGALQEAVFARAQADIIISLAAAAAQKTAQSLQTLTNMQV